MPPTKHPRPRSSLRKSGSRFNEAARSALARLQHPRNRIRWAIESVLTELADTGELRARTLLGAAELVLADGESHALTRTVATLLEVADIELLRAELGEHIVSEPAIQAFAKEQARQLGLAKASTPERVKAVQDAIATALKDGNPPWLHAVREGTYAVCFHFHDWYAEEDRAIAPHASQPALVQTRFFALLCANLPPALRPKSYHDVLEDGHVWNLDQLRAEQRRLGQHLEMVWGHAEEVSARILGASRDAYWFTLRALEAMGGNGNTLTNGLRQKKKRHVRARQRTATQAAE